MKLSNQNIKITIIFPLTVVLWLILSSSLQAQKPTVGFFSPTNGPVGTTVTITGTNFSTLPAGNKVFFGATQAVVSTATASTLIVTVPSGASYKPISVLTNGLLAYSLTPFIVTFESGGAGIVASTFPSKEDLVTEPQPYAVSIGDLDGDGLSDLVVANSGSMSLSVFRSVGTEGGTIIYAAKVDFETGSTPIFIAAGDLDGDGKADLAVTNLISSTVSIFRNTSAVAGSISFAPKVDFTTGALPYSVAIGDLDGDGKADLAVANGNSNSVSVLRNTSSGPGSISYESKVDFTSGTSPRSVSVGDLDLDGKMDLVVSNYNSNTVSLFRNASSGPGFITYAAKIDLVTEASPGSASIGDLDHDGKADLAVCNFGSNTLSIFRNTGSVGGITFADRVNYSTGTSPISVAIGDLDGDGKADLAVANHVGNTVSAFRNTSTAAGVISYAPKMDYTTESAPNSVAIGDLNGDGKADLAVSNTAVNTISIFENKNASSTLTITGINPTTGAAGTVVTITGTNFSTIAENNIVKFNGIVAETGPSTISTISTVVPAGATSGKIIVEVAGQVATSTNDFVVTTETPPNSRNNLIAGGYSHSLAICSDGTLKTWGGNIWGQLGNGTSTGVSTPEQLASLTDVVSVADTEGYSLVLKSDGTVWAWGNNLRGQLGNGTATDSNVPVQVNSLTNVTAIAGGGNHALALKGDGTVWAWGDNASGQLGNGESGPGAERYVPVQITSLSGITSIAGGWLHSLALKDDGTVWSWGSNGYRQLGNGTTVSFSNIPVQVSSISSATAISASRYSHSLAVLSDGTVWTWGRNDHGQLGIGSTTLSDVPVQLPSLSGITAVSGGYYHSLALKNDGTVHAWGWNFYGELGNGTKTISMVPVHINSLSNIKAIASGAFHSLALENNGNLKTWGHNVSGQLGTGNNNDSNVPVAVAGLCATESANAPTIASFTPASGPAGTSVSITGTNFSTAAAGNIVKFNGTVAAVTGTPTTTSITTAVPSGATNGKITVEVGGQIATSLADFMVTGITTPPVASHSPFAGGGSHTLIVCSNSTVRVWGDNWFGQLGVGTNSGSINPVSVTSLTDVKAIAGGSDHSLALKTDGTVWAFGYNIDGQLGNASYTDSNVPVQVASLTNITAISAGANNHSLALKDDGTVWSWGRNAFGELGNGTYIKSNVPVPVSGLTGVVAIAGGTEHSLALLNDGTVWAWGFNENGQLGNGTTSIYGSSTPVAVNSLTGVTAIAGAWSHSVALKNDGTVWSWGGNFRGELGNGSTLTNNVLSPVQVSALSGVTSIATGRSHSLALKNDGTVWAWGVNQEGALGVGTTVYQNVPLQVNSLSGITHIAAGDYHSIALKDDGTLWAWGKNGSGQIGDGTVTQNRVPVQVNGTCSAVLASVENLIESAISIYPNPASSKLTIQVPIKGQKMLYLFHSNGKFLHQLDFVENTVDLDLNAYQPGTYLIIITTEKGTATGKFLKED